MVYLNALKNKSMEPRRPMLPKVYNLTEEARHEPTLFIYFQKSTSLWYCFNGHNYPVSQADNRLTYMSMLELDNDDNFTTYSIQDVSVYDICIDNNWVTLLSYEPTDLPNINPKPTDDSGLIEGKCNLKNITFEFDGQRWFFVHNGTKVYFHSDIFKTTFSKGDIPIEQGQSITFREITGTLTKAGNYWIFILHRKVKQQ